MNDHPSSKPAYFIAEIEFTDRDGYMQHFAPLIAKVFNKFDGFHISRGGAAIDVHGHKTSSRIAIVEFPSLEKAEEMLASDDYQNAIQIAHKYSNVRIFVADGLEISKRHYHPSSRPAYRIAEIEFTDRDGYIQHFAPLIATVFNKFDGFYISRHGTLIDVHGHKTSTRIAIVEFPSLEKAEEMLVSHDYKDAIQIAHKYSTTRIYVVDGLEIGKRH